MSIDLKVFELSIVSPLLANPDWKPCTKPTKFQWEPLAASREEQLHYIQKPKCFARFGKVIHTGS